MRTKEEEHKLIETFDQTTAAIKNDSRPVFAELLKATEEYQKSLAQTVFCGTKVTDIMKRIVQISPDPEMTKGLEDVADILATYEKHLDELSKFMLSEILVPMRQQHDEERKFLPEFIKKVKAQRKQSEKAVKDAELAANKAGKKGAADLKTKMEEISKQEQNRQQQLSEQLKEALQAQRGKFCLYVKCWNGMFMTMKAQDEEVAGKIGAAEEILKKIGDSANEISAAQVDLVTERKRTFINLANISAEWKQIFKDAGISKKDLRDSETAKLLLDTLERAGINISSLTGESFDGVGDGGDGPASPSGGRPAPPPRGGPPAPPPRAGGGGRGAPPPPPPRGGAPPPPSRGPSYLGGGGAPGAPPAPAAPAAPPPPGAPPPPPSRAGGPPPPPSRSPSAGGASLLDQIHQGTKLKSAADRKDPEPIQSSSSSVTGADLTSLLMSAMSTRRVAMKEEAKDDDDDWGDDNDEWSD